MSLRLAGDKTYGLIGSTRGVVQIALREPHGERVFPIGRPRNVAVSLDRPDDFIRAVEEQLAAG